MSETYTEQGHDSSGLPPASKAIITNIFQIDSKTLEQLAVWLEGRGLSIPLSQITGYSILTQSTRVQTTSNHSKANGTTTISFDQAVFDSGGMWDAGRPSVITAQSPGKFVVGCGGSVDTTAGGPPPAMFLRQNGSNIAAFQGVVSTFNLSTLVDVAVGDQFSAAMQTFTGVSQTISSGANLWAARVTL